MSQPTESHDLFATDTADTCSGRAILPIIQRLDNRRVNSGEGWGAKAFTLGIHCACRQHVFAWLKVERASLCCCHHQPFAVTAWHWLLIHYIHSPIAHPRNEPSCQYTCRINPFDQWTAADVPPVCCVNGFLLRSTRATQRRRIMGYPHLRKSTLSQIISQTYHVQLR